MSTYRDLSLHPDQDSRPALRISGQHYWIKLPETTARYTEDPLGEGTSLQRHDVAVALHLRHPEWARDLCDALTAYLDAVGEPVEPEEETIG